MASLKEIRDCTYKRSFPTRAAAEESCAVVEKNAFTDINLKAYKCGVCSGWHRTTNTKRK